MVSQLHPPSTRPQDPGGPPRDPLLGVILDGRYRVESLVARGGMATVYRGMDLRLDRTVAIKVMHPSFASDPGFVARFEREARAAARLNSACAVAVHDQGSDHGVAYLVMEYVPGHTVRDVLRVHGSLPPEQALAIIEPVLEALAAAHRAGYVHRDVKPENVLISDDGRVKVTDFGLARAIETSDSGKTHGLLLGTVAYLSPEQVEQDRTDARSDVYSAGILLFELLTGSVPFSAAAPLQVAYKHVHEDVPLVSAIRPELSPGMVELVRRATRRDPGQRFADADGFLAEVRARRAEMPPAVAWRPAPTDTLVVGRGDGSSPQVKWSPDPAVPTATSEPADSPEVLDAALAASVVGPEDPTITTRGLSADPVELATSQDSDGGHTSAVAAPGPGDTAIHHGTATDMTGGAGKPRRRRARVWLGLVGLASVVGLLAFLFGPMQQVTVPDVAGRTAKQASALMAAANLKLDSEGRAYSETVPKGQIITTDPLAGASTRNGTTVRATVSRGPERYDVPKLAGATPEEAAVALKALKLVPGTKTEAYHDTVAEGRIISTSPDTGTSVKPGTEVALTLSKGPKPIELPNLVGTGSDAAAKSLRDLGLKVKIDKEISESVPKGNVVSMSPAAGKVVPSGSTVKLVESKGPPMITVPNVVGKNRAEATAILEGAGFKVKTQYPLLFGTLDRVHSQTPKGGASLAKGSTVTIEIV